MKTLQPNKKIRIGDLQITCYGEEMIMINHPQMPAPKPVGPKNPDEFWAKDDGKKLESTLEHFDKSIDWGESDPDCLLWLAKDIDKGLDMVRD